MVNYLHITHCIIQCHDFVLILVSGQIIKAYWQLPSNQIFFGTNCWLLEEYDGAVDHRDHVHNTNKLAMYPWQYKYM